MAEENHIELDQPQVCVCVRVCVCACVVCAYACVRVCARMIEETDLDDVSTSTLAAARKTDPGKNKRTGEVENTRALPRLRTRRNKDGTAKVCF